jgi:hypothetical protein
MSQNDSAVAGALFDDVRQRFHDVRGQISIILSAVEMLRADAPDMLSPAQHDMLARIEATTATLTAALDGTRNVVLDALALSPTAGHMREIACLDGDEVQQRVLKKHLDMLHAEQPDIGKNGAILIAPAALLPALRRAFGAVGWRLRIATAPADARFLLDAERADLIIMAPPPADMTAWWRTLRVLLQGYHDLPLMLHLVPVSQNDDRS